MKRYVCSVCGYVFDEAEGIPENGIAPGTKWEELPEDWVCPLCKADKSLFNAEETEDVQDVVMSEMEKPEPIEMNAELSALEMSVICTNLARGCEKQYMPEKEEAFKKLADFFMSAVPEVKEPARKDLIDLVNKDLEVNLPYARKAAEEKHDRGALRAIVWSEKVTAMLRSLLERYEAEGDKMLENTGVYICTVCGFISIGEEPPELCPVCKVPSWKFEKVLPERRGS